MLKVEVMRKETRVDKRVTEFFEKGLKMSFIDGDRSLRRKVDNQCR